MAEKRIHFDVCIGNPPYQVSDGGNNASATPVYNLMIDEIKKMDPENIVMIIPDRWFSGGRGLDKFRQNMINDSHIQKIVDYQNANECFPGMDISAGICYFLWNKKYLGDCRLVNIENGQVDEKTRRLNQFPILVRSNKAITILEKVVNHGCPMLSNYVSSQKPFGLGTYARPDETGELVLRWNKGRGPISKEKVIAGHDLISKWNVIVSRVFFEHAGKSDKDGMYRVISVLDVLNPNEVCSETYVVVNSFDSEEEARNLEKYLKTKFVRYLILQATSSIMITKQSFLFVPVLNFKESWDDEKLYKEFNLNEAEIREIESRIKEMN